jgi:hypothetical protein
MLVEERIYTLRAGATNDYLALYESEGLPVQRQYLPAMVGYYTTEIGPLNQVIHLWAYQSFEERTRCRGAMRQDPRWPVYLKKLHPLLLKMENKLLIPAPFFDLKSLVAAVASSSPTTKERP